MACGSRPVRVATNTAALAFSAFSGWRKCCGEVAAQLADIPTGWYLGACLLLPLMEESRVALMPPVDAVSASAAYLLGGRPEYSLSPDLGGLWWLADLSMKVLQL